jgi:hypothetical protein
MFYAEEHFHPPDGTTAQGRHFQQDTCDPGSGATIISVTALRKGDQPAVEPNLSNAAST